MRPALTAEVSPAENDLRYAWSLLPKVSRSFAFVTQYLDEEKKSAIGSAVMVFYHVCRVLDTIEDSPLPNPVKENLYQKFLAALEGEGVIKKLFDNSSLLSNNAGYRELVDNAGRIISACRTLAPPTREVIRRYAREMAQGMHHFNHREITTFTDLDEYCHPVAGIIGYALTELFHANGHLPEKSPHLLEKARHFGLALQKVNIIRDFGQDEAHGRHYWPRTLLESHGKTLPALREMIDHSRPNVEGATAYFLAIPAEEDKVRMFCGVSLMLALETLQKLIGNADVFLPNPKAEPLPSLKVSREEFLRMVGNLHRYISDNRYFEGKFSELIRAVFETPA